MRLTEIEKTTNGCEYFDFNLPLTYPRTTRAPVRWVFARPIREGRGGACAGGRPCRFGCDVTQACCPWNQKFAQPVKEPMFEARAAIAGKDARTLAAEILAMSEDEFRSAFKGSAMKRAKVAGLRRNSRIIRGDGRC